jgi:ABC-type proline/glycine betaine transport system permease subunit
MKIILALFVYIVLPIIGIIITGIDDLKDIIRRLR